LNDENGYEPNSVVRKSIALRRKPVEMGTLAAEPGSEKTLIAAVCDGSTAGSTGTPSSASAGARAVTGME
jgi:hypothetical protein